MKKTLIAIGLLICTAGITCADETLTPQLEQNAVTQVQVQNELDKATFNKEHFNQNPEKFKNDKIKNKIKYDDSVSKRNYKNFDKKTDKKFVKDKYDMHKSAKPDIRNNHYNYRNPKPFANDRFGKLQYSPNHRYHHHKADIRNYQKHNKVHRAHKSQINKKAYANYKRK